VRSLGSEASMMRFDCTEQIKLGDRRRRCVVGVPWQTASKRAVLWGDSHAKHLLSLLDIPAREQGLSVVYWAGCPPFVGNEGKRREIRNKPNFAEDCAESRKELFDWLATSPKLDLIILSNAWAQYPRRRQMGKQIADFDKGRALGLIKEALTETVAELKPEMRPVLMIGDVPSPGFDVPNCALQAVAKLWREPCKRYQTYFNERDHPVETILADMASDANHIYFLNSKKGMCDAPKGCSIRMGDEIIYRDGHHLRHDLSLATREKLISKIGLRQALSEALGQGLGATQAEIPSGSRPAHE